VTAGTVNAKSLAVGPAFGIGWGLIAVGVFAAMRAHLVPAPLEVSPPSAIGSIFAYLPVILALGVETLLSRSSPSFAEVIGVTVACGMTVGMAGSLIVLAPRHRRRSRRRVVRP
jgi:hypothetical protein